MKNRFKYIIAKEQYLNPLLETGRISMEVYNEVIEGLYNEYEIWKTNNTETSVIKLSREKINEKQDFLSVNPDFINITNIAKNYSQKSSEHLIQEWLRDKRTIEFLTLWEKKHNDIFLDFYYIKGKTITVKSWVESTNSIGLKSKQGKGGGTYAHKDIAVFFMCWLSPVTMLEVITKYMDGNKNA